MSKDVDVIQVINKAVSSARRQASIIYDGPRNIVIPNGEGGNSFYGWPVLALQRRTMDIQHFAESRICYANPFDTSQHQAILRAVIWNPKQTRLDITASPDTYQLAVPARFVSVSMHDLERWLTHFVGINLQVAFNTHHEGEMVKKVRIEMDYITNTLEVTWVSGEHIFTELEEKCDAVWSLMGSALLDGVPVETFSESYRQSNLDHSYVHIN